MSGAPLVRACAFSLVSASVVHAGGMPVELDPVLVTATPGLDDTPLSSTEGFVTKEQIAERPITRASDLLEFVPGLMVTQHSGEGKANQYFLRGFNLDHGTDFYTEVDGLPVNMRSHAHGQGYADLNFVIPELIGSIEYRKGPYYADVGDFGSAGSANLRYVDELPHNLAKVTAGEWGYLNALLAGSPRLLGGTLLLAGEHTRDDGPFEGDENVDRTAGLARFSRGTEDDGVTLSLMAYHIRYRAPDQIPMRAVEAGDIGRFGSLDPSDGGSVGRYSLSGEWRRSTTSGYWRTQAYAMDYRMRLFSNFSYFLDDPVNGDQFSQFDDRRIYGVSARRYWAFDTAIPTDFTLGLQSRYDDVEPVGLHRTRERERLSTVREDQVQEASAGLFASTTQRWAPWFRSQLGLRFDAYDFDVDSDLPVNSGDARDTIVSPKLALVFGPWARTHLFANYGEGFHSNDARGITTRLDPADGVTPQEPVDPLVKARGGEIGISSRPVPSVSLATSLWALDFDSELVYVGDAGANEPSGSSRRHGIEVSGYFQVLPRLAIDADYAWSRARLDAPEGNRIPNAIEHVFGLGLVLQELRGWSGGLRVRHLGKAPLVEDGSRRSKGTTLVNAQVGYRVSQRMRASLDVFNLFDSRDHDVTYFYTSRLPGEPAEGVDDLHFHPVEPRSLRLSAAFHF